MSQQITGHVVMHFSSIWSLHNELNAFRMSIYKIMSCGRALLINLRVAWMHYLLHRNQFVLGGAAPRLVREFAGDPPEHIVNDIRPNVYVLFTK